jgi:hypothetical protein
VARHRILTRRRLGHPSKRRSRRRFSLDAVDKRHAPETEAAECRESQANLSGDVAEGVAPLVAVGRGVGKLANADAIENNEDDAGGS